MRFAFYKAAKKPGFAKVWSLGIAAITGGPYSHCEIVFPLSDPRNFPNTTLMHDDGGELCFGSAEADGGTRFKQINLSDGKWDLVEMPDLNQKFAMEWCLEHQGIKYDWAGLRGFVFPWDKPNPADLFCSEALIECAQDQFELMKWPGGGKVIAGKTSPNDLATCLGLL